MGLPSTIAGSQLANGVKILGSGPVDFWAGPYDSAADACDVVPLAMRPFRTVIVAGEKMWWLPSNTSDEGLIPEGTGLPDQSGNAGKVLGTDGSGLAWVDPNSGDGPGLPAQAGQAGKYLKTNGSAATWEPVPDGLPPQSAATAGKVLKSDGSAASWQDDQQGSGATTPLEPNLSSNSTTAAPTVAAVNTGLGLKLDKASKADAASVLAGVDGTTYITPEAAAGASLGYEAYVTDLPQDVKDNVTNASNWDGNNRYVGPAIPNGLTLKILFAYSTIAGAPSYKYEFWPQNRVVRIQVSS